MKRIFLLLFTLMATLLAFTACGEQSLPQTGEGDAIGDTLRIGMSCDNPPFSWTQDAEAEDDSTLPLSNGDGYVGGYDVQVAKEIADQLGVNLEIVQYDRGDLIGAVEDGDIDLMIAGVNPLATRADRIDFTDSYYDNDYVVIVLKDGSYADVTKISGFAGARITAQTDSYIYTDLLPQMEDIKIMPGMTFHRDMRVALSNDIIDGYVTTRPEGMEATRLHPEYAMVTLDEDGGFETDSEYSSVAIGLAKGRDVLLAAVNGVLHKISDDQRSLWMERAVYAVPENYDDTTTE